MEGNEQQEHRQDRSHGHDSHGHGHGHGSGDVFHSHAPVGKMKTAFLL